MDKEEIIRRLKKLSEHAVHVTGELPFIISLDDGIALGEAVSLLKEQEAMEQCLKTKCIICPHCDNCDVDENGLLKEQEPKPVLPVDIRPANERFATMKLGYCPKCGKKINSVDHKNYCGECSQEVKWDG